MSVREFCGERGISPSAYYRRLRRVREMDRESKPAVVPIRAVSAPSGSMEIVSGEIRITVSGNVSPDSLECVIRALKSC